MYIDLSSIRSSGFNCSDFFFKKNCLLDTLQCPSETRKGRPRQNTRDTVDALHFVARNLHGRLVDCTTKIYNLVRTQRNKMQDSETATESDSDLIFESGSRSTSIYGSHSNDIQVD